MGAPEREHQPDNWYRQAEGIETHSAITRAVQEGELYLTDTSAHKETSKRAHPFLPQLCSATQKRQGSFPVEVCFVSLPWGRSSESSEISLEFQKGEREREDMRVIANFDAKPIILKQKIVFFLFCLVLQGIRRFWGFFSPLCFLLL